MSLVGQIGPIGLDEVLQVLSVRTRSGVLTLMRKDATVRILINNGQVVYASSDTRSRLGYSMVQEETISDEDLALALKLQKDSSPRKPLGTILLEHELVTQKALETAIRRHVMGVFRDLMDWKDGYFHFNSEPIEEKPLIAGKGMSIQFLLLEAARNKDEERRGVDFELWP